MCVCCVWSVVCVWCVWCVVCGVCASHLPRHPKESPTHPVTYPTGPLARCFNPGCWGRSGDGPQPLARSAGHQTFDYLRVESVLQPGVDFVNCPPGIPFDPLRV